jgi:hypothetical protein
MGLNGAAGDGGHGHKQDPGPAYATGTPETAMQNFLLYIYCNLQVEREERGARWSCVGLQS